MEEQLALQAALLKDKIELLEARFRQLRDNISNTNDDNKNQSVVEDGAHYSEQNAKFGTKLKQLKDSLISSVLNIYHDYDFSQANNTLPNDTIAIEGKTGAQLMDSVIKKFRNNLDSPTERQRLNDILTKQAVSRHLKNLKALESLSANLFNDMLHVRQGAIEDMEISTKKSQEAQISAYIIDYISKTSKNSDGKKTIY